MSQRRRSARPYVVTLVVLWVVPLVVVVVGHLVLPTTNASGQCEGIGWGCVPAPADGIVLFGMLAAPFLVAAGALACAVIAGLRAYRDRRPG